MGDPDGKREMLSRRALTAAQISAGSVRSGAGGSAAALRLSGRPQDAIPVLEQRLQISNQTEAVRRELDAAQSKAG